MLSLVTPAWLFGLALLPLIRWLHRGGRHRRVVPVAHLPLWRAAAASPPAAGERQPPDPAWRRRALLAALLFVVLAEPRLTLQRHGITVWVDDSLSMLTREAGANRLASGLQQLRSLLAGMPDAEVELRALGDPWRRLGAPDGAGADAVVAGAGRSEPGAPPAGLLQADRQHWLLTDGADAGVFDWPDGRRPDRVIQVGRATRNVGLERLAARRSADAAGRYDLLLKLTNGGDTVETRELVVGTEAGEVARSSHRLEPGASVLVSAAVPAATSVQARLLPGDLLAEDDTITLDLHPLQPRRVAVDAACAPALHAALASHPALTVVPAASGHAEARLLCRPADAPVTLPSVRVLADQLASPVRGPLQWAAALGDSGRLAVDPQRLRVAARLQARAADSILLAAAGEPLMLLRAGTPAQVETGLDFTPTGAPAPQVPLLVNLMFEQLWGQRLLDSVALADRGPTASRVAALPRQPAPGRSPAAERSGQRQDATRPLLLLAMLALVWEIVALVGQWLRLRPLVHAGRA